MPQVIISIRTFNDPSATNVSRANRNLIQAMNSANTMSMNNVKTLSPPPP